MESKAKFRPDSGLKRMDPVRQVLKGGKRHPKDMGNSDVEGVLNSLASEGTVSASTQGQVLNAIGFLYREVLDQPIQGEIAPVRAGAVPRCPW